ncbi:MAG: hypothetical protein PHW93_05425 [Candidatus Methanomethylophilaceae archaeon]|nr:hypothetical protein [Candidatus Methanomethylophilaceae archaeon]
MELSDLASSPIPEVLMIAGGAVALYVAVSFLKDKDSQKYKLAALVGMLVGIVMLLGGFMAFQYSTTPLFSVSVMLLTGFAMFFRPIQKIPVAAVFGLIVGVFVYLYLGGITDPNLQFLADGMGRLIVAIVAAALVFMVLNFIEQLLDFASTVLNAWPVLLVLGFVCLVDGAVLLATNDSLMALIVSYTGN